MNVLAPPPAVWGQPRPYPMRPQPRIRSVVFVAPCPAGHDPALWHATQVPPTSYVRYCPTCASLGGTPCAS